MATELAVIHSINSSSFNTTMRPLYYAKDDSCIATTSSYYAKTHDLEEFSSLFKKGRRCSHTLVVDVSFELEVMRNSLGKIALQRRMDRRCSQDSTISTGSNNSVIFTPCEEESPLPLSPKVNFLLKELENCLVKIQQQHDISTFDGSSETYPDSTKEVRDIPSVTAQTIIRPPSMTAFTAFLPSIPTNAFSNRGRSGSGTVHDKYSENMEDPSDSFPESTAIKNNITVSEVYITATLAGWILKLNSTSFFSLKSWKKRFLVLTPTTLFRFKSSAPETTVDEYLELTPETIACVTDKFTGKRWVLEIASPSKSSWYIQTESLDELKTWLNALKASVIRAKYCNNRLPSSDTFNIPLTQQDHTDMIPFIGNSRRDSASSVPLSRPKTLRALNGNSKSMSALPPQLPIPGYLPPGPPTTNQKAGTQRQRTMRAPSAPATFGASITKIARVGSFTRRLQTNHKDNSQPSSKRNSAVLPTLNEDA